MAREYCIDPYTPEELKAALRTQATNDPLTIWTGEYGLMTRALERILELEAQVDALQNEINAVEWVNGRMERELEQALRK